MKKNTIYLYGWITLLIFPLPSFFILGYLENKSISELLDLNSFFSIYTINGLIIGILYALLAILLLKSTVFEALEDRIEPMIRELNLSYLDMFFLSLCAGIGEELLFRVGVQYYLGPWLCSFIFVAIHGYFNPKSWRKSLYGAIVFPFILLISYGYILFGIWFCIAAHFAYDLLLFIAIKMDDTENSKLSQ